MFWALYNSSKDCSTSTISLVFKRKPGTCLDADRTSHTVGLVFVPWENDNDASVVGPKPPRK